MTPEEREREAKLLLDNPLFVEAFKKLEEELLDLWKMSGSTDTAQRESFWLAVRLLDRIKVHIQSIVETGHMARVLEEQHPHI
tara:strand:+ start:37 stop:285 length:249 start_codon:yes stop_codon:yes gene_type:complete